MAGILFGVIFATLAINVVTSKDDINELTTIFSSHDLVASTRTSIGLIQNDSVSAGLSFFLSFNLPSLSLSLFLSTYLPGYHPQTIRCLTYVTSDNCLEVCVCIHKHTHTETYTYTHIYI